MDRVENDDWRLEPEGPLTDQKRNPTKNYQATDTSRERERKKRKMEKNLILINKEERKNVMPFDLFYPLRWRSRSIDRSLFLFSSTTQRSKQSGSKNERVYRFMDGSLHHWHRNHWGHTPVPCVCVYYLGNQKILWYKRVCCIYIHRCPIGTAGHAMMTVRPHRSSPKSHWRKLFLGFLSYFVFFSRWCKYPDRLRNTWSLYVVQVLLYIGVTASRFNWKGQASKHLVTMS